MILILNGKNQICIGLWFSLKLSKPKSDNNRKIYKLGLEVIDMAEIRVGNAKDIPMLYAVTANSDDSLVVERIKGPSQDVRPFGLVLAGFRDEKIIARGIANFPLPIKSHGNGLILEKLLSSFCAKIDSETVVLPIAAHIPYSSLGVGSEQVYPNTVLQEIQVLIRNKFEDKLGGWAIESTQRYMGQKITYKTMVLDNTEQGQRFRVLYYKSHGAASELLNSRAAGMIIELANSLRQ